MMQFFRILCGLLFAALMTACGGGGGSAGLTAGGSTTTGTNIVTPAAIEIFSSSTQLSSASSSSVSFTVVAKDANNQAIPNQTVTFSASSGNLAGALPPPKTGAAGEAITTVSLSPGGDPTIREITVTASSGGVSKSIVIPVVGTALSLSGDASILLGGVTTYTAKALDSAGRPISGASMTVSSSLANNLNPSTLTTDAQGAATFIYTANHSGLDTLTLTGLGTTARTNVSVSGDDFSFESPSSGTNIIVGSSQTVTVRFLSGGVGAAGRQVTFSTTRGTIIPNTATTDANGRASAVLSSSTSGPANVIAQVSSAQATLPVAFIATTPASLVLQANPGSLPPNTGSTSTNQAALQAIVRDAAGNPVPGRVVNFSAITDGSNGIISPGSGTTDANGTVVAQFIPGGLATAANGVVISATVQGTAISGTASLTVSGQALFISIASGNVISNLDVTTYQKEFSVYVTDANGAPAANRVVNLSVFPDTYGKGTLSFVDPTGWQYSAGSPTFCPNEDVNRNGILNVGEDTNGDGRLTPGLPVIVSPATVTTASNGFATFFLQFGENFVPWLATTITARASVGGTESVQSQRYFLEGVASDFTSAANPPQGVVSPYGTDTSCQSPN
ncbi:MAG: Ig-like, group 1 [Ramlibacter sp.]|nr:Ig-like, group 1 [Ramlibacter sp.]